VGGQPKTPIVASIFYAFTGRIPYGTMPGASYRMSLQCLIPCRVQKTRSWYTAHGLHGGVSGALISGCGTDEGFTTFASSGRSSLLLTTSDDMVLCC
jgi:hypothetical protein